MRLSRKNKTAANPNREELAGRIAGRIIRVQSGMAAYLNSKTRHLTRRKKLLLLIAFCLLFAAINLWLLIGSMTH